MKTTRETLFGRDIQLNSNISEDVIAMHPKTWERIRSIAYRNAVQVVIENVRLDGKAETQSG